MNRDRQADGAKPEGLEPSCAKHSEAISLLAISCLASDLRAAGLPDDAEQFPGEAGGTVECVVECEELLGAERHITGCAACNQRYQQLVKLAESLAAFGGRSEGLEDAEPTWLDDAARSVLGRLDLDIEDSAEGESEEKDDGVVRPVAAQEASERVGRVPAAGSQRRCAVAGAFERSNTRELGERWDGDLREAAIRRRRVLGWGVMTSAVAAAAACWLMGWLANQWGIFPSQRSSTQNEVAEAGGAGQGRKLSDSVSRGEGGARSDGVAQAGVAQAGVAQAGVAQAGVAQAGVAQAGAAQAGAAQAGAAQAGASAELLRDNSAELIQPEVDEGSNSGIASPAIATMWELRQSVCGLEGDFEEVLARGRSGGNSGAGVLRALDREWIQ